MTIEEKINKLQAELDELKSEAAKKEVSYNWTPKDNECYFFVDSESGADRSRWEYDSIDKFRLSMGNCFKTKEEAEQYLEYLTVLQELRVFAREKNKGVKPFSNRESWYYLELDTDEGKIQVDYTDYLSSGGFFFNNEIDAKEAITHFGDRLKILFEYNL